MKSTKEVKTEIINKLWNTAHNPPMSDPKVHTFIENLILEDRRQLLSEVLEVLESEDSYYDAIEAFKSFKQKIK